MRDIKFRAYIKDTNKRVPSEINKIVEVKSLHLGSRKAIIGYSKSSSNYGNYSISFDDIELMQYTGLHDKNGKEIYEGDIVKLSEKIDISKHKVIHIKPIIAEISWSEEYLTYVLITTDIRHAFENVADYLEEYNLEVIGNIYDNPELLEKGAEE